MESLTSWSNWPSGKTLLEEKGYGPGQQRDKVNRI